MSEHDNGTGKIELSVQKFKKFDEGKLRWNLMPLKPLEEVLKVMELGATKYGDFNWVDNHAEVDWTRYTNAADRHWIKFKKGIDRDEETNLYELAHTITNLMFLLEYQINNLGKDNRRKQG